MRVRYSFSSRKTRIARGAVSNHHKKPFPRLAKEVIRISDIILQVLDSRFIDETRNEDMENFVKEQKKVLIYIINKIDLADKNAVMDKLNTLDLKPYVLYSCKSPIGRKQLRLLIKIMVKKEKFAKEHNKAHVGVIGYPNTGKSSIINTLAAGGKAAASPEFAFTRGIKRIRFTKDILILDTPGVFGESENIKISNLDLKKQTEIGVRNASIVENPEFTIHKLMNENPGLFEKFYNVDANSDSEVLIDKIGRLKGFLSKGNQVNADKTARYILEDWQSGKIKKTRVL